MWWACAATLQLQCFSKQAGDLSNAAATAFAANSTQAANAFVPQAAQKLTVANDAASVQQFCEVAVLLLIIVAFAVIGPACARRLSSEQQLHDDNPFVDAAYAAAAAPAWMKVRRQILGTAAFVFVTFLLRAVFSTMNALSSALQNDGADCPTNCGIPCNNVWSLIQDWLNFTPEFQLTVVLISSPLALLFALWGMTDKRTLQHMRAGRGQTVRMVSQPLVAAK